MAPEIPQIWRIVAEAVTRMMWAAPAFEAHVTPHAAVVLSGEPVADLNMAIVDGGPAPELAFRAAVQLTQVKALPCLFVLTPAVSPALVSVAQDLGLTAGGSMPLMVAATPANPPVPRSERYTITQVDNAEALQIVGDLTARAFDFPQAVLQRLCNPLLLDAPGLDLFVAWRHGIPWSTVWTMPAGETAGIFGMGTPAEFQRQGAGRAVLEHAMAYHAARGVQQFYLLATAAGEPLYRQLSFEHVAEADVWIAGHSTQVH